MSDRITNFRRVGTGFDSNSYAFDLNGQYVGVTARKSRNSFTDSNVEVIIPHADSEDVFEGMDEGAYDELLHLIEEDIEGDLA